MSERTYIPDTTTVTSGGLRLALERGEIKGRLVIHSLLVTYFERLAKESNYRGFVGLRELKRVRELCAKLEEVVVEYARNLPEGVRWAKDVDVVLRELAFEAGATLLTSEPVNAESAQAMGVEAVLLTSSNARSFALEPFFSSETLSVHLKESVPPRAKVGRPGKWRLAALREEPMSREELEAIASEIIEYAKSNHGSFIESEKPGSTIVQVKNYRVVITRPPLSDSLEITAVRPIVKLRLEDYGLPQKLMQRLEKQAEGILIAGAPGMGKTTLAQALAEHYLRRGRIVKTIESPRDMQLPTEATQYSKVYTTSEELHDILLLSRPDYTVFDEMRDTRDFELYADLRLAGIGMVGVVHATSPIDAIQRFIKRVELGMIPSIIDTVIFIENGEVTRVYELETVVKVPHGLREEELARPVVVVKDFVTGEPEYELYVFGDRTFVVPVRRARSGERIKIHFSALLSKYVPSECVEVTMAEGGVVIAVDEEYYNYVVGKPRRKLERLARRFGVNLEIRPRLQ